MNRTVRIPILLSFFVAMALLAAACSSSGDVEAATAPETTAATTEAPAETAPPETVPVTTETPVTLPDYFELAAEIAVAADDRSLPPEDPDGPTGAYGYSRYVYSTSNGEVVPSLIEGPRGRQVRCQQLDQLCSYQELKALYESGDDVPEYLNMDRDTLGELVGQLDRVNIAVMSYDSIADACAAGLYKSTNQSPNMGIHMIDPAAGSAATGGEFNPDQPQMVLFAKEDGQKIDGSEIGNCTDDGGWSGEDGFEPVGAVFNLNLQETHPDGFAGDIDNWHIHYNTCISRNRDRAKEGLDMGEGGSVTQEQCENSGGSFIPLIPSWMMHAYVADDFDAQAGVFSMFNPTVWPVVDTEGLYNSRATDTDAEVDADISNFDFGSITAGVGETIRFSNSDSLPHTVTAGSASSPDSAFDSGLLGTGQSFDLSFDTAGEYELFCVLHPDMTAVIEVG